MNKIFIIEHLEPRLWKWCFIEYKHISSFVGKQNLWFTNVKNKKDAEKLKKIGNVFEKSVKEIKLKNLCVLDPESDTTLNPKIASKYEYFVFGGILGDYPPKKRTKDELSKFIDAPAFNIGKKQMATDNAVYVVKQIVDGKDIDDLNFKYKIEINMKENESVELPYNYVLLDGKPLISHEIIKLMKKRGF
jgi:ribosome biogenesis SPOUT family RNA methylase Rps3